MAFAGLRIMGVLNVTPDSFYDGGRHSGLAAALKRAEALVAEGADIIDVGGESTRPGSLPVPAAEEVRRVVPVVRELARTLGKVRISVDTRKAEVARLCLDAGADIINDVSAMRDDPGMAALVRTYRPTVVLMHMRRDPLTMQKHPRYRGAVREVKDFLKERVRWAEGLGVPRRKIWVDPGIGFGKTVRHNLELLKHLREFSKLGCPVLVGLSRKTFIGKIAGNEKGTPGPEARLEGSIAGALWCHLQGASVLRVHDPAATLAALRVFRAIQGAR